MQQGAQGRGVTELATRNPSTRALIRSEDLRCLKGEQVKLPRRLDREGEREQWRRAVGDPGSLIAVDLFCGAGGLSYGFEKAGFTVAVGIDHDQFACETHAANLRSWTIQNDVAAVVDAGPRRLLDDLGVRGADVIIGGPPCQGFSMAGLAKVRSLSEELREEIYRRNYLYRQFIAFVRELEPPVFVMENVPQISTFADGLMEDEIRRDFAELGYSIQSRVLEASQFGVPQSRRRRFFLGSRRPLYWSPRVTHGGPIPVSTLRDAIRDLPAVEAPALVEEMNYTPPDESGEYVRLMRSDMLPGDKEKLFDHVVRPVRRDDQEIFRIMQPGHRYHDVPPEYRRYSLKRNKRDGRYEFSDRYYKLPWDQPCVTITAHMAKDGYRYIHPEQIRTLSVREAARVQSFPDHFRFAGSRTSRYVQIGNAVPPLMAQAIAEALKDSLRLIKETQQAGVGITEWRGPLYGRQAKLPLIGTAPSARADDQN